MRKWVLLVLGVLFLDCQMLGYLQEKTSLDPLRKAGIPVESFLETGMEAKEARLYLGFWKDLEWFPVAGPKGGREAFYFEDTWHAQRSYKGERLHEGCDIFGSQAISGYYPVVSITEGLVEQVGWLPLGGWRIGIRSPGGGYFYYAHLDSYSQSFQIGEKVKAGEVLGFLGDSGYGEEGTTGMFTPHLHLGIYVETEKEKEHVLDPYPVLQFLQERQKNFFY